MTETTDLEADAGEDFSDQVEPEPYAPEEIPPDREVYTTSLDTPVKSLMDEIEAKNLIVNPPFQRRDVWDRGRKSRLIESLLLNIPIPVIFLAEDTDGVLVVVDGQQRLRAVEQFLAGRYALSGLEVLSRLNGQRWADLTPRQGRIIKNRTLRCIVIGAKSDDNLRFEVFERLNTGGVSLNDQEIRNSLYRGHFNQLLNTLVSGPQWLGLVKRDTPDVRLGHHEMTLRFFAMLSDFPQYKPPLKTWLSDYMREHRSPSSAERDRMRSDFELALRNVAAVFGGDGKRPFTRVRSRTDGDIRWDTTLNRPVFELQMLGLMREDQRVLADRAPEIVDAFVTLSLENEEFADALSRATADRTRTLLRFRRWGEALDRLGIVNQLTTRLASGE